VSLSTDVLGKGYVLSSINRENSPLRGFERLHRKEAFRHRLLLSLERQLKTHGLIILILLWLISAPVILLLVVVYTH
jgi:hypothetical protein